MGFQPGIVSRPSRQGLPGSALIAGVNLAAQARRIPWNVDGGGLLTQLAVVELLGRRRDLGGLGVRGQRACSIRSQT